MVPPLAPLSSIDLRRARTISAHGTLSHVSSIVERYDRDAEDYERYWAPVLDASARRLLDRVGPLVSAVTAARQRLDGTRDPSTIVSGIRILDVGTGTGVLALEALARWPDAQLIGADASAGMLARARRRALNAGIDHDDARVQWLHAPADRLDIADASVDIAVSSFVYQLVPDRAAAFAEARRVLRPSGWLSLVTWLDRGPDFAPAVEFDEAVYDLGIEEPEEDEEQRAGDFRSPRSAAGELRAAGFKRVSARAEILEYPWSRESYLEFKVRYDERALFSWLDRTMAKRLTARAKERFAALPDDAFTWQAELVSIVGQRPGA